MSNHTQLHSLLHHQNIQPLFQSHHPPIKSIITTKNDPHEIPLLSQNQNINYMLSSPKQEKNLRLCFRHTYKMLRHRQSEKDAKRRFIQ